MSLLKSEFHTHVGDFGIQADSLVISSNEKMPVVKKNNIVLKNAWQDLSGLIPSTVMNIETTGEETTIFFSPLLLHEETEVILQIEGNAYYITRDSVSTLQVDGIESFKALRDGDVLYRLYSPNTHHPRPLILFLHGGGECGSDNILQMIGTMGAISLQKRYPDMYIMAPQASNLGMSSEEALKEFQPVFHGNDINLGDEPFYGAGCRGWNRDYLGKVADIIRTMISKGVVDPERVYVTGMSMGGGGTLMMLQTAPDLFAAALPVCPSMNCGTLPALYNLPNIPTWIASAYIDHQENRHAYLLRACSHLWETGRKNVHLTLFTSGDLAKYNIGINKLLTKKQLLAENHNCWTLVYHNEMGLLDWLTSHRKGLAP